MSPPKVARRGIERREVPIPRADVDCLPPDRGRCIDVGAGAPRPEKPPRPRAERIERSVGITDVDPPVRECGRRVEVFAPPELREGCRLPAELAGSSVEWIRPVPGFTA